VTGPGHDARAKAAVLARDFDASTLSLLREQVMACAAEAGLAGPRSIDVTLAIHELAANVIRHGSGSGRLRVHAAEGVLRCQVSDTGPGDGPWPVQQGHGLWLVRQVANQITMSHSADGSEVTVVFTGHAPAR
jgi:anti-sigma regulatory factor (Ser/Thr protein kinase)